MSVHLRFSISCAWQACPMHEATGLTTSGEGTPRTYSCQVGTQPHRGSGIFDHTREHYSSLQGRRCGRYLLLASGARRHSWTTWICIGSRPMQWYRHVSIAICATCLFLCDEIFVAARRMRTTAVLSRIERDGDHGHQRQTVTFSI